MTWKKYLPVYALSIIFLLIFFYFQRSPGYMDAEYYFSMGLRIAKEHTFSEPYIWNYLTDPAGIPHPGFSFWMPLPAFVSSAGAILLKTNPFIGARILFILIAAAVPVVTLKLNWKFSGQNDASLFPGLFAVFPFLYSSFLGTTDSFGLLMVLGGIFFWIILKDDSIKKYLILGLIAGLMHLARADGIIWLLAGGLVVPKRSTDKFQYLGVLFAAYLLVMGPWFARNLLAVGYLMPPSSSRMFWLTEYNDLFNLNSASLTPQNWVAQGFSSNLRNITSAILANLKTVFIVQGQIILAPLLISGIYSNRKDRLVRVAIFIWSMIFIVMSVVFPFAGMRGGFFHSGAAMQPMIWVLALKGFYNFINWGEINRNWKPDKAKIIFGGSLIILIAGLSIFTLFNRVIGTDLEQPIWNQSYEAHQAIGKKIEIFDEDHSRLIMLNNPPGFHVATGRSAIVIPNGGVADLLSAADKYDVSFLVLDTNHPKDLTDLYDNPTQEESLTYLGSENGIKYFQFRRTQP